MASFTIHGVVFGRNLMGIIVIKFFLQVVLNDNELTFIYYRFNIINDRSFIVPSAIIKVKLLTSCRCLDDLH